MRGRPIFFLTLHVGKTGSSETGKGSSETGSGKCHRGAGTTAIIASAGSCPPKPSASLHPVACHCVHSGSSRHPVARPGASRSVFAPPIHMAMGGHGFREGTACRPPRQQLLPPASPTTAPACLANITHRLLTGKTRRQERKASHEDRTRKQVRKAGPEGRTGRQGRKAGWGRRMAKQCALRERCEILCIFAVLKY